MNFYEYEIDQLSRETSFDPVDTGYFRLRPIKHKWLSDLLWKALEKMGALEQRVSTVKTYVYTPSNKNAVTDKLTGALLDLAGRQSHGETVDDYAFIMGNTLFNELAMSDLHSYREMPLADFRYVNNHARMTFRGLSVHVIPSMSGFALVPKVVVEK